MNIINMIVFIKTVLPFLCINLASARPNSFDLDDYHSSEEYGVYAFTYDIDDPYSGNFYGHSESRNGGHRTEGSYYVRLPDSRLMTVEYYADETGYHPTITFQGEAQYPSVPVPSQSFQMPTYDFQPPKQRFVHGETSHKQQELPFPHEEHHHKEQSSVHEEAHHEESHYEEPHHQQKPFIHKDPQPQEEYETIKEVEHIVEHSEPVHHTAEHSIPQPPSQEYLPSSNK